MFLDGAGWHRSKELLIPKNMKLIFIPPYSPELNPAVDSHSLCLSEIF
jgi:transposase